ncbi:hypothetical protein [Hymenobacter cavernae]|uniref:IS66 family transposase n=1 Tax=Hymenobacter cavernae TaxID=2044852 RepID=A0ABQ1TKF1_9BACT|nr:hypothetical protein [Hymenobacter cavernae]GGE97779.1 hypothetical protein GCM10011383_05680 [Hymenobacter cavernae]
MTDKTRLAQLEALLVLMLQRQDKLEAMVAELQAQRDMVEQRLQRLEEFIATQQQSTQAAPPQPEHRNTPQTVSYLLDELLRLPHYN